jgi:hypothetical protein
LQAGWVGEVRCIGVCFERDICVRCVLGGEVRGEIVEAAVMRFADEGDAFQEGFCGGGVWVGDIVDVAEAVGALGGGQIWREWRVCER